jgi:hypothetical protein
MEKKKETKVITTVSGYQKSAVKKQLIQSILRNDLEPSCHWCAELVKSGDFADVWECVLLVFGKHVHAANPKLALYLQLRADTFRTLASTNDTKTLHTLESVRKLFTEMMCLMCTSPRKHALDEVPVDPKDFQLSVLRTKVKAPTIEVHLKQGDPLELVAPFNELLYSLRTKRSLDACYWLEWVLMYEKTCAKKKSRCKAAKRDYLGGRTECVWIFWDLLLKETEGKIADKYARATLRLYCIQYGTTDKDFRRFLLYFAIALVCDPIDFTLELPMDKAGISAVCAKHALFYAS